MGDGGEYGGETDKRERDSYESKEHDEEEHEREVKDLLDELEREMDESKEEADELAKDLERELEDEERAREIVNELEKEMEEGTSKELDDEFERDLGHDLDEVRYDLHEDFTNDMERQLDDASTKDTESAESDTGTSSEMTESSESYGDAGGGMAYAMETKGDSEGEPQTESEQEGELEKESQESTEQQTESEAAEEPVNEKGTNRITRQESEEGETTTRSETEKTHDHKTSSTSPIVSETEEETQEVKEGNTESEPAVSNEDQHETGELSETVEDEEEQTEGTITETSEPDAGPEDFEQDTEDATESYEEPESEPVSHEKSEAEEESVEHREPEQEMAEDPEVETEAQENETSAENEPLPEDLEDFVRRVQVIMDEKMDADDDYDYVQDLLTGEMQRVPKILVEHETKEQKERRKLQNLFAELSEEERERFKEIVRENAESEEERSAKGVEKRWTRVVEVAERTRKQRTDVQEVHRLYFDKGLSMLEVGKRLGFKSQRSVQRIFREQGWEARPSGLQRKSEDYEEMYRLYFKNGHTLKEIAQRFGMDRHTIGKIFREQGWITRRTAAIRKGESISRQIVKRKRESQFKRSKIRPKHAVAKKGKSKPKQSSTIPKRSIDPVEVYKLYFVDGLTMMDISKKLGFKSAYPVSQLFKEMGWKPLTQSARKKKKDFDVLDVFRLYYIEGLIKEEVASELGIPESRLRKVFKEMGWPTKIRQFETQEERALGRKDTVKKRLQRIKDLRADKFGTKCRLCGQTRKLAIHKKDGIEHERDLLWRLTNIESADSDEWAALCISCHRGIHWLMDTYGYEWDTIESLAALSTKPRNNEPLGLPTENALSSPQYLEIKEGFDGDTEALRRALFGDRCYYCGVHSEEKKVPIHRKDGRPHDDKLTKREKYFRTLNPDGWVPLCNKHHRYVHWAMDTLNLEWDDLKSNS